MANLEQIVTIFGPLSGGPRAPREESSEKIPPYRTPGREVHVVTILNDHGQPEILASGFFKTLDGGKIEPGSVVIPNQLIIDKSAIENNFHTRTDEKLAEWGLTEGKQYNVIGSAYQGSAYQGSAQQRPRNLFNNFNKQLINARLLKDDEPLRPTTLRSTGE